MGGEKIRVVQWATGNIGTRSLRATIDHPQLELVGLLVHSEEKAGRDAGELCGASPTGVIATRDVEAILGLRPDCVLYMADRVDPDAICRLLESGANVVATRAEFHRPERIDPETRERIESACARGGSSLHSTGSSPGFITEALPIVLTSLQRRLGCYTIDEYADMSSRDSPEMIFDLLRFGSDPAHFDASVMAEHERRSFGPSLELIAEAVGLPLDAVESRGEVAVARRDVEIAAGRIEAGTVAALRFDVAGLRGGETRFRFRASWYLTTEIDPAWELGATGWRVRVDGDAPLDVGITFPVAPEDYAATSPGYTAHRAVNAVPAVVAAEPGIRTTIDLPQVIAQLG